MRETLAIYAGSFDPLTVGHLWMIEQGAELFDRLIVAVGVNPEKRSFFPVADRLEMVRQSTGKLGNVEVDSFTNQFLIHFAREKGARFMLRGIRSESDYEYERGMRNINGDLNPSVTTVFLMPPRAIAEVSSSMVKGLIGPAGWEAIVQQYTPAPVYEQIVRAVHAK